MITFKIGLVFSFGERTIVPLAFGLYCLSLLDENPQLEIIKVTKIIGIPF
ncbi:hypothetical protein D358_02749 [Enterococcus faecalis RP2S-4]|uniref:Uncharacterized protein n=1 Tax=Enterococcus faecalis RP2S-4 TaxID=1244145 RepID=A0ABC9THL2_ENTFL|nr:hypothetical protein D358_02749 [Enterococcus faecalis RP2S-4]